MGGHGYGPRGSLESLREQKMTKTTTQPTIDYTTYARTALPHLESCLSANADVSDRVMAGLEKSVLAGGRLFVGGSGHSTLFGMELYHRAGGPSFVRPVTPDYLIPTVSGPSAVRVLERSEGTLSVALKQAGARAGEMFWLCSQSGINRAVVDAALVAKQMGLHVVAFTSRKHSLSVESRHASGKRLCEIADDVIDLQGTVGDAAIEIAPGVSAGPLSSLTSIFLAHSILLPVLSKIERSGRSVTYISVNTPEGERKNVALEKEAAVDDWRLR